MIKSFKVNDINPQEFIDKVMQNLTGRELGKIATMSISGKDVLIAFSKLGKSEVIYNLTQENSSFICTHKTEKIAFTHKALRSDIESKLAKVLESVGAVVEQG